MGSKKLRLTPPMIELIPVNDKTEIRLCLGNRVTVRKDIAAPLEQLWAVFMGVFRKHSRKHPTYF